MFHRYLFLAMMSAYKRRTCPLLQTCNNFEQRKNKFYRVHAMAALIFVERIAYREITRQNIFSKIFPTADRPFFFPFSQASDGIQGFLPTGVFVVRNFHSTLTVAVLAIARWIRKSDWH